MVSVSLSDLTASCLLGIAGFAKTGNGLWVNDTTGDSFWVTEEALTYALVFIADTHEPPDLSPAIGTENA